MPSRRSELRASASEKVLRLAIMLRSGCAFSARTVSNRRRTSRAACDRLWPAAGSATSRGISPFAAASGSFEAPPVSAITGDPVRPWKSMVTAVSARTGALRSMAMVACTCLGLSESSSETRHLADADAVEQHGRPRSSPDTGLSKRMR